MIVNIELPFTRLAKKTKNAREMIQRYEEWVAARHHVVPDNEERLLKVQLAEMRKRSDAVKLRDRQAFGSEGRAPTIQSAFVTDMVIPNKGFAALSLAIRRKILDFVPVVAVGYMQDLAVMRNIVAVDDVSIFNAPTWSPPAECSTSSSLQMPADPDAASTTSTTISYRMPTPLLDTTRSFQQLLSSQPLVTILNKVDEELEATYFQRILSEFSQYARLLGVVVPDALMTEFNIDKLSSQSFFQHAWFSNEMVALRQLINTQRGRYTKLLRWVQFRETVLNTPCHQLRLTIRDELETWEEVLAQLRHRDPNGIETDVMFDMALSELRSYKLRTRAIEFLGDPLLSRDDARNLFWEVGIANPPDVTDDYLKTITFRQAMTLGLVDVPWVKGYSWECRTPPAEEEAPANDNTCAMRDESGGVVITMSSIDKSTDVPRAPAASSYCSASKSDRIALLRESIGGEDALKKQMEDLESDRIQLETLADEKRKKAFLVAVDGMSQRLWLSTATFRPRWEHRFRGCEYCNQCPIAQVGLRKENSGAVTDIVLCQQCFDDLYADEASIPHRMYDWYVVKDLIDSGATAID